MIYLILISIFLITYYMTAVCIKQGGIPNSISATFYKLEHKYWFMATMWLTAGLLMPAVLEVSRPGTEWLAFLACAGVFLVGAAPNFKDSLEGKVHTLGTVLCVAGSQLWVAFNTPWILLVWVAWLVGAIVYMSRHVSDSVISDFIRTRPMFWMEVTALIATYLSVLLKL